MIRAGGVTLRATMKGQGVSPSLALRGEDGRGLPSVSLGGGVSAALLQMPDVLVGEEATARVQVVNTSEFSLRYTLVPMRAGHSNRGSVPPFDVSPLRAEVPKGGSRTLSLRFSATHASDSFSQVRPHSLI